MSGYPLVACLLGVVLAAAGCVKREPPAHALNEAAVRAFIDESDVRIAQGTTASSSR